MIMYLDPHGAALPGQGSREPDPICRSCGPKGADPCPALRAQLISRTCLARVSVDRLGFIFEDGDMGEMQPSTLGRDDGLGEASRLFPRRYTPQQTWWLKLVFVFTWEGNRSSSKSLPFAVSLLHAGYIAYHSINSPHTA